MTGRPADAQGLARGALAWLARLHALHADPSTPAAPLGIEPPWI